MSTFREQINEAVSPEAQKFMKDFNKQVSFLKDEVKESGTNNDWKVRLESIEIMIKKELDK